MKHDVAMHAARRIVGDWEIDPPLNELRHGDETLRIEPKAMELLVFLADRPGQVVGRAELLESIWPGVVVGDEALTQAVTKLRKALRDHARAPAYIETIAKRGYRLVAAVRAPHGPASAVKATAADETTAAIATPAAVVEPPAEPPTGHAPAGAPAGDGTAARHSRARARALLRAGLAAATMAGAWLIWSTGAIDAPSVASNSTEANESALPSAPAPVVETPTIVVVPFETLSDSQEYGYLARGIAADLATDLSRLTQLAVVVAAGAPPAAGVGATSPAAASDSEQLRYVVSGTLQRDGQRLRVNVRLADAVSRRHLWSDRYEAAADDLLAVQKGIVSRLLDVLPLKVGDAARESVARRYTRNPAAYDYFLRGQGVVAARGRHENEQARAMYRKALDLDPTFARAYAMLAVTYALDHRYRWPSDVERPIDRAAELAKTACSMNSDTPEAWWALGFVQAQRRLHNEALGHFRQAVALNPTYAEAWAYMGAIHVFSGEADKALPVLRAALRMHAEGRAYFYELLARAHLFLGDHELALINLREAIARNPTVPEARIFLAATLAARGEIDLARWEGEEIRTLFPGFDARTWLDTFPMTDPGYRRQLAGLLAKAGL